MLINNSMCLGIKNCIFWSKNRFQLKKKTKRNTIKNTKADNEWNLLENVFAAYF